MFYDPEHKLFVGMLPKNVSDAELSALFSQYGTIKDFQILRGCQQTSKGKFIGLTFCLVIVPLKIRVWIDPGTFLIIFVVAGCAFLKYETKEQALAAIEELSGKHKMEVCVYYTINGQLYMLNALMSKLVLCLI